jgi:hypothetical protein
MGINIKTCQLGAHRVIGVVVTCDLRRGSAGAGTRGRTAAVNRFNRASLGKQ